MTITDRDLTRFLMPLDSALRLVERARSGDLFIRKEPASTVGDLDRVVTEAMNRKAEFEVIGNRHGEKLYETLATREEPFPSKDQGSYCHVALDARDLSYGTHHTGSDARESVDDDYQSHSTDRLDVDQVVGLLHGLPRLRKLVGSAL